MMNRITALDARKLVEESKIENIYDVISRRAVRGSNAVIVPHLSKMAIERLLEDDYRIYADSGTMELTKYDPDIEMMAKEYEISWED